MKRSTERFLTTHTGSLPRPDALVRMMFAQEAGVALDQAALRAEVRTAVDDVVRKQAESGIDIVNDGEASKPGYATYVKDRLTGFDGETPPLGAFPDLEDFPVLRQRMLDDPGRSRRNAPTCTGPISVRDREAAATDATSLREALGGVDVAEGFISAASPGVISRFLHNQYYASHEEYLFAVAEAMRYEYETVAASGLTLQIDCPDLAMGRHIQFADLSLDEFQAIAHMHVEALNYAVANIPPDQMRMHLCWGNYEGPHHFDVALSDIIDIVFEARPSGISFEAANPRHAHEWTIFEEVKLPDGKVLIPGVVESTSNFIEHPDLIAQRIGRYAALVGRENVLAGSDCGFGTWVGQATVDADVVWAKFAAMAEGAQIATAKFWP